MSAIYNEPYLVRGSEFVKMIKFADYYRCLRIVSRTIGENFYKNANFAVALIDHSADFIEGAVKLRNETLFRDCLILQQSPWTDPQFHYLKDVKLSKAAAVVRRRIKEVIGDLSIDIMHILNTMKQDDPATHSEMWYFMQEAAARSVDDKKRFCAPKYYRLLQNFKAKNDIQPFEDIIKMEHALTDNNMVMNRYCESGSESWEDCFFCGEVREEDLPWDITEEDW